MRVTGILWMKFIPYIPFLHDICKCCIPIPPRRRNSSKDYEFKCDNAVDDREEEEYSNAKALSDPDLKDVHDEEKVLNTTTTNTHTAETSTIQSQSSDNTFSNSHVDDKAIPTQDATQNEDISESSSSKIYPHASSEQEEFSEKASMVSKSHDKSETSSLSTVISTAVSHHQATSGYGADMSSAISEYSEEQSDWATDHRSSSQILENPEADLELEEQHGDGFLFQKEKFIKAMDSVSETSNSTNNDMNRNKGNYKSSLSDIRSVISEHSVDDNLDEEVKVILEYPRHKLEKAKAALQLEQDLDISDMPFMGTINITLAHFCAQGLMNVTVHQVSDMPSKKRGGKHSTRVYVTLLPTKKKKYKTKVKIGADPEFNEMFTFNVQPEHLSTMGVHFQLYEHQRLKSDYLIGEAVIGFSEMGNKTETSHTLDLMTMANLSVTKTEVKKNLLNPDKNRLNDSIPRLRLGIAFSAIQGLLTIEVLEGSNFRTMSMKSAPDTYVKLVLVSHKGKELSRCKTPVQFEGSHPQFMETFVFNTMVFMDVTLMVLVYVKRSMKRRDLLGWFAIGHNNSSKSQLAHWDDVMESKGRQVARWHKLTMAEKESNAAFT